MKRSSIITSFFYDVALHLALPLSLVKRKRRRTFYQRLGYGVPKIEKGERELVWIHAVSFGETRAALPLVKALKERGYLILLSTVTETGYEEGVKSSADWNIYLPFDVSYIVAPIVRKIRPDFVLIMETDFWMHFQQAAHHLGAKVAVVNGKMSERSMRRHMGCPFFSRSLYRSIDLFCVQGKEYEQRFRKVKVGAPLRVTGNIKLDADSTLADPLDKREGRCVITAGSTHDPEEKIWIEVMQRADPKVLLILVPRHPERFERVAKMLDESGLSYSRWSGGIDWNAQVILVDAMGVLKSCYAISDLAFVGGTFAPKVGGHNLLEPSFYAVPVIYGPHTHAQPDLRTLIESFQAGKEVEQEMLSEVIQSAMEGKMKAMGERGYAMTQVSQGALLKTLEALKLLGLR